MGALLIVLFRSALPHHSSRTGASMVTLEKKQGTTAVGRRDAVFYAIENVISAGFGVLKSYSLNPSHETLLS